MLNVTLTPRSMPQNNVRVKVFILKLQYECLYPLHCRKQTVLRMCPDLLHVMLYTELASLVSLSTVRGLDSGRWRGGFIVERDFPTDNNVF